ncbi:MAG: AAA family ATPase [Actinomycetaceae bacterium]|nr:AAA family ATPase [Actinomycetaceae bacterium]MDY6083024.1 AAA family ATPase [Actinomycetaceae bacterium]
MAVSTHDRAPSPNTFSSAKAAAIASEQQFVDRAYGLLDAKISDYSSKLSSTQKYDIDEVDRTLRRTSYAERDEAIARISRELQRLTNVEDKLVFGRLDFTDGRTEHIGRIGLLDDDQDAVLLDWRAPQAQAFYQATGAHPLGAKARRHIATRSRTVIDVDDELLEPTDSSSTVELTGEGALMQALGSARSGRMSDIVATIQTEQDAIIRADSRKPLVVQGGPGTGKTAVALHRAAYVLYTERKRLERSGVLIVGPSHAFLRYIDKVLPSLGETDVVTSTIADLLPGIRATGTESTEAAEVKGRLVWRDIVKRAVRDVLEAPLREPVHFELDRVRVQLTPMDIEQAQTKARRTGKPHNEARQTYAAALVQTLATQVAQARNLDEDDNQWIAADISDSTDARRVINSHWLPSSPQWLLSYIYSHPRILASMAPELTEKDISAITRGKEQPITSADVPILDELAETLGEFITDDARHRQAAAARERQEIEAYAAQTIESLHVGDGRVAASDLADRVQDQGVHSPLAERAANDRTWTYGHVVVDEAQELSPMAWEMLIRRCPSRSFTIVGDIDQRVNGAPSGGWKDLLGRLGENFTLARMTISYRTPARILDAAATMMNNAGWPVQPVVGARDEEDSFHIVNLPVAADAQTNSRSTTLPAPSAHVATRSGNRSYSNRSSDTRTATTAMDDVTQVTDAVVLETQKAAAHLDSIYATGDGLIGVIVPQQWLDPVYNALDRAQALRGMTVDRSGMVTSARIHVMSAQDAKGLEYDAVIVLDPGVIFAEGPGNLYVALTRTTHTLTLLAASPLPSGLGE